MIAHYTYILLLILIYVRLCCVSSLCRSDLSSKHARSHRTVRLISDELWQTVAFHFAGFHDGGLKTGVSNMGLEKCWESNYGLGWAQGDVWTYNRISQIDKAFVICNCRNAHMLLNLHNALNSTVMEAYGDNPTAINSDCTTVPELAIHLRNTVSTWAFPVPELSAQG